MGDRGAKPRLVIAAGKRPTLRKASRRDWTKAKEAAFLTSLAETCNVTRSAEAAGVSTAGAYKRRRGNAAFRAAWAEAIGTAYQRLELELLERALNGTEKVVKRRDGSEERMREHSNTVALTLLRMHRESAVQAAPESAPDNIEEIREKLFDKLERVRKREEARDSKA